MHIGDSRKFTRTRIVGDANTKGWPDLVLARGTCLLFRELKSERTRVSKEQEAWLAALKLAGQDVDIWRPQDWDRIIKELGGLL